MKIIDNSKLVEMFGTNKNKNRFLEFGKINNSMKKSLLGRAQCEYIIEDLGRGKYEIISKRPFRLPRAWFKIQGKKEEYLCYLILSYLKENAHAQVDDALDLSLINCYTGLKAISSNYCSVKYNQLEYSDDREMCLENVNYFFKNTTESLEYYLKKCLNLLQDTGALKWQRVRHLCEYDFKTKKCGDKKVKIKCNTNFRRATKEETQFEERIRLKYMKQLDISEQESYFGEKSKEFNELYQKELDDRNIKFFYGCYEVYYCNVMKLDAILESSDKTIEECEQNFNQILMCNIIENAEKYLDKIFDPDDVKIDTDTYFEDVGLLVTETIDLEYDAIKFDKKKIEDKIIEMDI